MSKTILVTGGSSSGKSRWAASYLNGCDYVLYLCTTEKIDPDIMKRIEFSNNQNSVEWDIMENITEKPASHFTDHKFVIFDSLPAYCAKTIEKLCPDISECTPDIEKDIEKQIVADLTEMFDSIKSIDGTMIIITLETGFSITPDDRRQRLFMKVLGIVNQRIANMCSEVYLSASGIQFKIK